MNIYSTPEKFDLTIIYECDAGESYTFDKMILWRENRTGRVLMGTDAG